MTSFETLIGLRYLRAKRRNSFISFISLISIVGIALGVAALIIVLSVMNGFQKEIRGRILGVASHLEISGMNNRLDNWRGAMAVARQDARVTASAPFVSAQGLLSVGPNVRGAMVRGGREPGVGRLANATDPLNVVKRAICGRFALHKKTICVMCGRFLEQIQT